MPLYLLSIYQPDGEPPAREFLEQVGRELHALNQESSPPARGSSAAACMRRARRRWCGYAIARR